MMVITRGEFLGKFVFTFRLRGSPASTESPERPETPLI